MAFATTKSLVIVYLCVFTQFAIAEKNQEMIPKNIIMVVGDGMGPAYTSAYRYFNDKDLSDGVTRSVFDETLIGSAATYPAYESGIVTDSAAGATALATGTKSYNGAIAMDVNRQPLNTVMREAKKLGMRTGLAVTAQIVHATPAAYVTHNESRQNYNQIADSYFDDRINGNFVVDIMLGGGTDYFERDDRDLVAEFIDAGYQYTDAYNKLATYSPTDKLLGLFAPVALPWALDDKRHHRLSYLTKHALKHLENDAGFFLLIEASLVDWAGHANDIASAMAEMDDLAKTMELLQNYVNANPDTLVVLTADHSTGGFTIGANSDYRWEPSWLHNFKSSPYNIALQLPSKQQPAAFVAEQLGFALTNEEQMAVNELINEPDQRAREASIKAIIDQRTNTGWTTGGHTGVDVPVFAMGASANLFAGGINNTDIGNKIFSLLSQRGNYKASKPKKKNNKIKREDKKNSDECDFKNDWIC